MKEWLHSVAVLLLLGSVDVEAQQVISIASGAGPMAAAIDPDANLAVVANRNNNTVSIIDLSSKSVRSTVAVGTTPTSVAINSRTHEAVVTNFGSDDISVIDLDTAEVIATLPVGNSPRDVAIDTNNNVAIVVNLNDGSVSLISLSTYGDLLPTPIQVGDAPISVAYNPVNHTALVANYRSGTVSVIDLAKKLKIADISVGSSPVEVAVSLEIARGVVVNQGSNDVTILNLLNNSVVTTISVGGKPYGADINPRTKLAAVLSNETRSVSLIYLGDGYAGDSADDLGEEEKERLNTKLATVISNVGDNPIHLVANPNDNTALTCNLTADNVTVTPLGFINYLPFVFDTDQLRTNLLINNLSSSNANVLLELREEDGDLLASGIFQIGEHGFRQIVNVVQQLMGRAGATGTKAMLKLLSDQPFSSFVSIIDNATNDPSLQVGRASGHSKLFINSVTNMGNFRSSLVILNLANSTATAKLTARDDIGSILAIKEGISIPQNGFYLREDILAELGVSSGVAALEIESPTLSALVAVNRVESSSRSSGFLEAVALQ
jgi:YVTN family beta-propeller protein